MAQIQFLYFHPQWPLFGTVFNTYLFLLYIYLFRVHKHTLFLSIVYIGSFDNGLFTKICQVLCHKKHHDRFPKVELSQAIVSAHNNLVSTENEHIRKH